MTEALEEAVSLVGARVALVAGPGLDATFLKRIRLIVHDRDPFGLLVGAMADAGLGGVPSLACAVTERGGVRLLVRGAAKALVKTASGRSETLTSKGVSTWTERAFTDVEELVLVVANGSGRTSSLVVFLDPAAQRRGLAAARRARAARSVEPGPPALTDPQPAPADSAGDLAAPEPAGQTRSPATADGPAFERRDHDQGIAAIEAAEDDDLDLGHLLGDTRFLGAEAAAVRELLDEEPAEAPSSGPAHDEAPPTAGVPISGTIRSVPGSGDPPPSVAPATSQVPAWDDLAAGDHDGHTISLADLRAVLDEPVAPDAPTRAPGAVGTPSVHCPSGHANPPQAVDCRSCRAPIVDRSITLVPRPCLGVLRFADGTSVDVDRPLVLGRRPVMPETVAPDQDPPRLVTLEDPGQGLSRVHAEVRIDGWEVLVVDRHSTNGTIVHVPGAPPHQLRPGEPCLIVPGTQVELGDSVRFELSAPGVR